MQPMADAFLLVICPIAIAYRLHNRFTSVSMSVCAHSHGRISWSIFTEIGTDVRTSKSKNEFVGGSTLHHPFPHFAPQNHQFKPSGPGNPCKYYVILYICLKCIQIAEIFASLRRNTMVTSDLRAEMEIWPLSNASGHRNCLVIADLAMGHAIDNFKEFRSSLWMSGD